ncbi:MAG: MMPL family transporter [Syntrophales bacterium]
MKSNPVNQVLRKLVSIQISHPLLTLSAALVLSVVSIVYTAENLTFHTSQKDLISPKERLIQLAERVNQFSQIDSFIVVIESPAPSRSLKFLHALVPRLEADNENYHNIFYRINPDSFKRWALLYLDRKDIRTLDENFRNHLRFIEEIARQPTLVNFFRQINQEMTSKMVGELFTGFLEPSKTVGKPFDLSFLNQVLGEMKGFLDGNEQFTSLWDALLTNKPLGGVSEEGYFWTKDKRYLLLFATPAGTADFTGKWKSLTAMRNTIDKLKTAFPDVRAGVTGPEALNADQMGTALKDMSLATTISIIGLTALFMIFWRGVRRPLMEVAMLVIALSWSFGLTTLLIGHLNILSVTFAPLLLGLGIDYGAHWFARYREEEEAGPAPKKDVLSATMEKVGPAILLAGLSLALSFFPMSLAGFKGLEELGIICTAGMIIMTMATLGLLPALIMLFDRPRRKLDPARSSTVPVPIRPFFRLTRRRALAFLVIGVAAFAISIWESTKLNFDLNMLDLQSQHVESVVWEKKLIEGSELSSIYGEVLAGSLKEVREKTKAFKALPTVSQTQSVISLLPRDQEEKITLIRKLKPFLDKIGHLKPARGPIEAGELEEVLGRIRFKMLDSGASEWGGEKPLESQMKQTRYLIDQIRQRFHSLPQRRVQDALGAFQKNLTKDLSDKLDILRANADTRPMRVEDLPPPLLQRFMPAAHQFLIRVYPQGDVWDPELLGRFIHDLRLVDPDVVGDPVTLYVFTREFRDSSIKAALYAVAFIFVFLVIALRDFKSTFMVLVPLAAGTAWTLGWMPLFKVDLNLANSIFLPLIVGAGVEYGIIIVYRWRQQEENKQKTVLPFSTATGVILAGLSTTVGFGSLMISSHRGIFSLGLLTTVGSLAVLTASVLFLPALMQIFSGPAGEVKPPEIQKASHP